MSLKSIEPLSALSTYQQNVGLDLRSPVFTCGWFYVGASRVTSRDRIKVIWDEKDREGKTKNIVFTEVLLKE